MATAIRPGMTNRALSHGLLAAFAVHGAACQEVQSPMADEATKSGESASDEKKPKPSEDEGAATPEAPARVKVDIQGRSGSSLEGQAVLSEVTDGVQVAVEVENAEPGTHGFHVHQKADCSAEDATSAGGHFAPRGHDHGLPKSEQKHLGDLGNLAVDADGTGGKTILAPGANLDEGDEKSFLGRALVIHANRDDGGQPTGNAGARIGCGEIPRKPEPMVGEPM